MILKLFGNPVKDYRRRVVMHLPKLEELDRVKVIEAERLAYRGLIKIDVDKMVEGFRLQRQEQDAKEKMERELYLDFMMEKGLESQTRMMKSLDEFAKMDEFDSLKTQLTGMLSDHKAQREDQEGKTSRREAEIDRQVTEVMERYSRK